MDLEESELSANQEVKQKIFEKPLFHLYLTGVSLFISGQVFLSAALFSFLRVPNLQSGYFVSVLLAIFVGVGLVIAGVYQLFLRPIERFVLTGKFLLIERRTLFEAEWREYQRIRQRDCKFYCLEEGIWPIKFFSLVACEKESVSKNEESPSSAIVYHLFSSLSSASRENCLKSLKPSLQKRFEEGFAE